MTKMPIKPQYIFWHVHELHVHIYTVCLPVYKISRKVSHSVHKFFLPSQVMNPGTEIQERPHTYIRILFLCHYDIVDL